MWRMNIPELIMQRGENIVYSNKELIHRGVDSSFEYVTPNDLFLHEWGSFPVYTASGNSTDEYGKIDGSYDYLTSSLNPLIPTNLDDIYKEMPISAVEIFNENPIINLTSEIPVSSFTTIQGEGKFYTTIQDSIFTAYDDANPPVSLKYEDFGIDMNTRISIDKFYDITGGDVQANGVVVMTGEKQIDLSSVVPILAKIDGESDTIGIVLEHMLGESINIQAMLYWEEFE
jgi:hypothetical protein